MEQIDIVGVLEGAEKNLRIFHGATGGDFAPESLTEEKPPCTFEAWKGVTQALAALRSGELVVVDGERLWELDISCMDCPVQMSRCRSGDIDAEECQACLLAYLRREEEEDERI